jgi:hypothetical protein
MMPAQLMTPAGQGQQRMYYAADSIVDTTVDNSDVSTTRAMTSVQ